MITDDAFPVEPWHVRETSLDLNLLAQSESLFALSNGHIGLRGNLDEGEPHGLPGTYLNSFYEVRPLPYAEAGYGYPEAGQTLVDVTNGKLLRLLVDDEPFDVRYGELLEHDRVLDMRAGTLTRNVQWRSPAGKQVKVVSTRLVSLAQRGVAAIEYVEQSIEVTAGGVGYGWLTAKMTPVKAQNRLWLQFVKQVQIVAVTLFLMLQFIWLIFRGNLGTLRMLAEGANRFSQGDHAVRIDPEGAPEVQLAAEAFNNMANNTENLIASLGQSESKNKLLATIVEQSSEAIWTKDLGGNITSWNSGAAAMFGYTPAEAMGHALNAGESTPEEEHARMRRLMAGEKFSYDARAMTKAGTVIDIQVAVAPLLDDGNQCIGSIAVARGGDVQT